jgi:hypothetical protein
MNPNAQKLKRPKEVIAHVTHLDERPV